MQTTDESWTTGRLFGRAVLGGLIAPILAVSISVTPVNAQTVAGQGRPSLDDCAGVLTPGRAWHSDMIFSQLEGSPQDPDIGISDDTTDNAFALQRAAHSYGKCLERALDVPIPTNERSGRTSITTRTTIESRRGPATAASSAAKSTHAEPLQKPLPHVPECMEHLKSFKSWKVTADYSFTTEGLPKVKSWTIASDLPNSGTGRQLLKRFAQCISQTLQVSQKPVFK